MDGAYKIKVKQGAILVTLVFPMWKKTTASKCSFV
jgi:hypothetical protein